MTATNPMGNHARNSLAHLPATTIAHPVNLPELAQALQDYIAQTLQERFLRLPEVKHLTGLSRTVMYGLIADDEFPRPYRIGSKALGRASGWKYSEVMAWINSRPVAGGAE